jgi:hypothetical protein
VLYYAANTERAFAKMPDRADKKRRDRTAPGSEKPRPTGMRAVAAPLSTVTRPVLKRRGLASGRVVSEWTEIVGATLASCSCPERLSQPRDGGPGILKIRVDGPLAVELQHLEPVIVERINGYFGYRAVAKLSMIRGPLPPRRGHEPAEAPAPDAAALASAAERAANVTDDALREALTSLGSHVLSRSRQTDRR